MLRSAVAADALRELVAGVTHDETFLGRYQALGVRAVLRAGRRSGRSQRGPKGSPSGNSADNKCSVHPSKVPGYS